jgi:hypothetical protein
MYIIQTILHYRFKNDILNLCTNANTGDAIFFTGFFGPTYGGIVSPSEAQDWCNREYDHDSWSNLVALVAITAFAAFFAFIVYVYDGQLSNPSSRANYSRKQDNIALYPSYNNQPFNNQPFNNQPFNNSPYNNQPPNQPFNNAPYNNSPYNNNAPYDNNPPYNNLNKPLNGPQNKDDAPSVDDLPAYQGNGTGGDKKGHDFQ